MSNGPLYALGGAHPNALALPAHARDVDGDAMRGLATGNRAGKAAEREQTIYTPWSVIEVCLATWNWIDLDPCSGADSQVPATARYTEAEDGLASPWCGSTYVNPPYKDLEEWLHKSRQEDSLSLASLADPDGAAFGTHEQILLFPVRPNRQWWVDYMRSVPTVVAWLRPLTFEGFEQAFPAPLVLVYTGSNTEDFREAAAPLSTFVGGRLA